MSRWSLRHRGAVAGFLATILTYIASLAVVFTILFGVAATDGATSLSAGLTEAGTLTALIGIFAVVLTAWFTLPLGCVCGEIYERARDTTSES